MLSSLLSPARRRLSGAGLHAARSLSVLLLLLLLPPLAARAALVDGPDTAVRALARGADGVLYLGGDFTRWGPQTGGGAALDSASGSVDRLFPKIFGTVYTSRGQVFGF